MTETLLLYKKSLLNSERVIWAMYTEIIHENTRMLKCSTAPVAGMHTYNYSHLSVQMFSRIHVGGLPYQLLTTTQTKGSVTK